MSVRCILDLGIRLEIACKPPTDACGRSLIGLDASILGAGKEAVYCKGPFKEHARGVPMALLSSYLSEITAVSGPT